MISEVSKEIGNRIIDIGFHELNERKMDFTKKFLDHYEIEKENSIEGIREYGGLYHVYYKVRDEDFFFHIMISDTSMKLDQTYVESKVICNLMVTESDKRDWYFNQFFDPQKVELDYTHDGSFLRVYPKKTKIYDLSDQFQSLFATLNCNKEKQQYFAANHNAYMDIDIYQNIMQTNKTYHIDRSSLWDLGESWFEVYTQFHSCGKNII